MPAKKSSNDTGLDSGTRFPRLSNDKNCELSRGGFLS